MRRQPSPAVAAIIVIGSCNGSTHLLGPEWVRGVGVRNDQSAAMFANADGAVSFEVFSMSGNEVHDRLAQCAGDHTFKRIGELTHTHPETVRRYMQGQAPSVQFLASLATALDVNPTWLLTGEGPMRYSQVRTAALAEAEIDEIVAAISRAISEYLERSTMPDTSFRTREPSVKHGHREFNADLGGSRSFQRASRD